MHFTHLALFFISLISLGACRDRPHADLTERLDSVFLSVPGFSGVLLLAENGHPLYHRAFGYRSFREGTPLHPPDIFELASVSKQFTAMTIMMLKEEGKLRYDDPVGKYLPGLPYHGVTIRHLLNHTSGLPDYQAVMEKHWDKSKVAGNDDNIAYLVRYHPQEAFRPGEKYAYSNTGYMLLASIAERASGTDFTALCRTRIFQPLGMTATDIRTGADKARLPNMAWGHLYVPGKGEYVHADSFPAFNYSIWLGNREGPGRVSSTAQDLLKWDQALYGGKLVSQETLAEAFMPASLNDGTLSPYGFGWILGDHPVLGKKVFHTGDNPGYRTIIIRYVEAHKTLILLSNNAHGKFDEIVARIERAISSSD